MAGDWIKMRGNLWDDPRVSRLCDLTEQTEAAVIGGLYWLWATADQHTEDGILPGLTLRQIDRKTGIPGLGQALCDIGWLADHPEGVRILRFEEHNGASAKKRAVTAKRVANHRSGNADVTQAALHKEDASVRGALAREREEKSNTVAKATDASASVPDAIWGDGLAYLVACGVKESGARSFIGKMRAELKNDLLVAELLMKAEKQQVADPVPWLRAASGRNLHSGRTSAGVAL